MADVTMELVGLAALLPEAIAMIRNGGTVVEFGDIVPDSTVTIHPAQLLRGKKIVGSAMYRPSTLPIVLSFLVKTQHRHPWQTMIWHRFPLDQINDAFPQAEWAGRQTEVTRAVLVP